MKKEKTVRTYCLVLFGMMGMLMTARAGAQSVTGTLLGVVEDPQRALVVGATIMVTEIETGQVHKLTTNSNGSYRVPLLPVGHYNVEVEKNGFKKDLRAGLTLAVAQEIEVNFTLQVGSVSEEVSVTQQPPSVNTTTADIGTLINDQQVAQLPINGRNFATLTLLAAGITEDKAVSGEGGGRGLVFSSSGASPWSNYYTLDGGPMMNMLSEGAGSASGGTLGMDGIQEFKVISSAYGAQYGMVMGGQVVIVSKSGTNKLHGTLYEYIRNSVLDARNYFDLGYLQPGGVRIPHLSRNDFGGSLGGPIQRDKSFFFLTYEGLTQAQGVTTVDTVFNAGCHGAAGTTITTTACPQIGSANQVVSTATAPLLALYPLPNLPNNQFTFVATNPSNTQYGEARFDHTFSDRDKAFVRYTVDDGYLQTVNVQNGTTINGPAYPGFALNWNGEDQFLTLGEDHAFNDNLFNTIRLAVTRNNSTQSLIDPGEPQGSQYSFVAGAPMGSLAVSGITGPYGINSARPKANIQTTYSLADDVYYNLKKHALKFGISLHRYNDGIRSGNTATGSMSFSSVANFIAGENMTFQALTPGSISANFYTYNTYGFYIQDDWRVSPRLMLNLGIRYEFMGTVPLSTHREQAAIRNIVTDANGTLGPLMQNKSFVDVSPRVGFAYDVFGTGRTSIHGAGGIYYDLGNMGVLLQQEVQGVPPIANRNLVSNYNPPVAGLPNGATPLSFPFTFPAGTLGTNPQIVSYYGKTPHAYEYNLGFDQALPYKMAISIAYVGMKGTNIYTVGEANQTIPTSYVNGLEYWGPSVLTCSGVVPSCRNNPNFTTIGMASPTGNTWYNALQALFQKDLGHGLEFHGAYTFSRDTDETANMSGDSGGSSGCSSGVDPAHRYNQKGPSCFDTPQNLRFTLLYHVPKVHVDGFAGKMVNGWWTGSSVAVNSGTPYTPVLSTNRSRSGVNLGSTGQAQGDNASINTAASIAANPCTSLPGQTAAGANPCPKYIPIPYNKNTAVTHNPNQWFNPAMFNLGNVGYLGSAGRDMLRAPGLGTWDFSLVKDTSIREGLNVQFRAEAFNLLNRANFGVPNGTAFSGSLSDTGIYSEAPSGTAGQITFTNSTSRQLQFAVRVEF